MNTIEFLAYLRSLDIQVWEEEDCLRCNAPEGILTPELRSQLVTRKTEILAFLQQAQAQSNHPSHLIKPVARGQSSPLSFAQQRLWFLNQLAPNNPFYNVPAAIQLLGELNLSALEQAFNKILCRHEALRTKFTQINGKPAQITTSPSDLLIPVVDLQTVPENDRATFAQQLAIEAAQQPFNLSTDSLLRVKLLKLRETEHILLLVMHHIVADGWSLGVLIRELGTIYTAAVNHQSIVLPDLPIQYADFAHWQHKWLHGKVVETQLNYWQQQLHNLPLLNLPTDRPRPPVQSFRGTTHPIALSSKLTKSLESLSQQEGVSLFMTLLAAFQILLYRYTGQSDIPVGSPIANRHHSELEGLIGFFVNSLVMRTDLSGNPTVRELLGRVREVTLQAYVHQDLPFEKLVEALEPERDLSRNPLFQVAFALQNAPVQPLELPGLTLKPLSFDMGTTRFDLEFHLWEPTQGLSHLWHAETAGLTGFVSYSTDLFDRTTIIRLIDHFQILLASIAANPDAQINSLPILSTSERQQLLIDWNQTDLEYDRNLCFHQLFESQAEHFPDLIAVDAENRQLTYSQLNQSANQLAHYLHQIGICPDTLVGLCVDRSPDALVGMLAILKAGGAFVPFDPNYPAERLSFILTDTQVAVVLTQSHYLEKLPAVERLICLDRDQNLFNQQSQKNLESGVKAGNLAYVIYTSGSTGQPKGVLLEHRGLCNVVQAQQQTLHLSNHSRILQFSSLSFDASVFEIAMALGSGGTLFIPPNRAHLPGTALHQFLRDHAITHAILPPAVLAVLPQENLPALKVLISGGEACSQQLVEQWASDRQFLNAYGPTETTIWATVAQLHPDSGKPSIGCPVANTKVYILDERLQPVPIGVVGELFIGGEGVARGYLDRPELTATRFIPSPFLNGERLYRTGDLARYRSDGNIEFWGRADDQIKLRGFRVELGEIEAILNQHSAVQKAIVLVHTHASEEQQLIAYFTVADHAQDILLQQQLQTQQIQHWQTLYNETYSQTKISNPTFNITGWNSSYTGNPIPEEQMQEWVNERSQHLRSLQPQRVFEIGCGTGLLLFQIAPYCTEYLASDFSQPSLDYIQQHLNNRLSHIKLLHQSANQFDNIPARSFDLVILNSIVQYFPTLDYLMQVLTGAIEAVAPGGRIFIGDVRNLSLLPVFHAAIQFEQADINLERIQVWQQVQRSFFEEPELAIDPAFFYALQDRFPVIEQVQIQLLRGHHQNEMTQFRYDVVLHIAASKNVNPNSNKYDSIEWLDWTNEQPTVATIRQHLIDTQPTVFGIANIANARITQAIKISEWVSSSGAPKTVVQMRTALENSSELAIDPQVWWDLETELPYAIKICWSDSGTSGNYDVLFVQQNLAASQPKIAMPLMQQVHPACNWNIYTNQPLQAQFCRQLVPKLRHFLSQKLPDYMVPAAFVPLQKLPLTSNGKIDRRALPLPNESLSSTATYVTPRSPIETTLVQIWTDLLRLKQVGIHDNFFELGGHSLLATQMASRLRDTFGLEVPLRSVFEAPTIAQLANVVEALQLNRTETQAPALVKLDRASHRKLRSSLTHQNKENQS